MKIVAPLTNIDCYIPLVNSGANEFYCGFLPYNWLEQYNNSLPINRRELLLNCNISSYNSMKTIKKMWDMYKKPVKITFNSHYYLKEQYPVLLEIIKKLMDIGFNTFIIADLALIIHLRENYIDCNIHLSGEAGPLNQMSIDFYNQYNISRYIFPLKTTLSDMKSVISNNKAEKEYEAFVLSACCPFSGEYCNTLHCDELDNGCAIPYRTKRIHKDGNQYQNMYRQIKSMNKLKSIIDKVPVNNLTPQYNLGETGCGLCKIQELMNIGITHLKVNGRGVNLDFIVQDVKNLSSVIDLAYKENDNNKFIDAVKDKFLSGKCPERCSYPLS